MVTKWGLSEKLGPLLYAEDENESYLGRSGGGHVGNVSGETAKLIDAEVRKIIDDSYATAKQILQDNRDKLDAMADALMKYETIDSDQIDDIMAGVPVREPKDWSGGGNTPPPSTEQPSETSESEEPRPDAPIGGPAGEH